MPLPRFLIIGAMKAGTTTLYRDLLTNPAIFMPHRKEPHNLCEDAVLTSEGREEYAALFASAKPDQICGEASTGYTKLPDKPGVPERALKVLGPELKVIYIVREPVARIISHHYHSYVSGFFGADIDRVVREDSRLLDYSRYAMQIEPWIDTLGRENVLIVHFESFTAARAETVAEVSRFLGIAPRPDLVDESAIFNKGDQKPVARGVWSYLVRNRVYRRFIGPYVPLKAKDKLRSRVLPKAPPRPAPPTAGTIRFIRDSLVADIQRLQAIMGRREPLWPVSEDQVAGGCEQAFESVAAD